MLGVSSCPRCCDPVVAPATAQRYDALTQATSCRLLPVLLGRSGMAATDHFEQFQCSASVTKSVAVSSVVPTGQQLLTPLQATPNNSLLAGASQGPRFPFDRHLAPDRAASRLW